MKGFATRWKASSNRRKQRKYAANAPLHTKRKFVKAALSKTLKEKHGKNAVKIKTGDKVKILRGQFKKKQGAITRVDMMNIKVYVDGIELTKNDGTKTQYPIHPSNLQIVELKLDDQKRKNAIARGVTKK